MEYERFTVLNFDYSWLRTLPSVYKIGNNGGQTSKVIDQICAFDIETSKMPFEEESFMYIWQFCFYRHCVVTGRTWDEFYEFIRMISRTLGKRKLAVYCHNLSYEFCWLKGLFRFEPSDVFCMDRRRILYCTVMKNVEFRCSYLLTNRSLRSWCIDNGAEHGKTTLEYEALRWPWSKLTDEEMTYCVNDVISLCECLDVELKRRQDTLATVPKTSTGFVRREVKRILRSVGGWYKKQIPDLDVYLLLRSSFRGGNTHASRFFSGSVKEDVSSWDISSSYPAQMLESDRFPMTPFQKIKSKAEFKRLLNAGMCVLVRLKIYGLRLKEDRIVSVPYIAIANCDKYKADDTDNGRLLSGKIEAVFNEIDLRIIERQYDHGKVEFVCGYWAKPGYLPTALRRLIAHYYEEKTKLKGIKDSEIPGAENRYRIAKEYINSIYGMMVQDPLKVKILFMQDNEGEEGQFVPDLSKSKEALSIDYQRKGWLPYQWGCWVTSLARERLQDAIDLIDQTEDAYFLYCDTDSVKFMGQVDFTDLNNKYMQMAIDSWGIAKDPKGREHFIGVYEKDEHYQRYLTLGAKKYFYEDDEGELGITVSGIPKRAGAAWLDSIGGLDKVRCGLVFPADHIGKLASVYNDQMIKDYEIEDSGGIRHYLRMIDNVYLKPVDYTLDLALDYRDLLLTQDNLEEIMVVLCGRGEYNVDIS